MLLAVSTEGERTSSAFEMTSPEIIALVVDDEPDNRELTKAVLEGCGLAVRSAESVRSALKIVSTERIALLVSDISMPEQDGYDLIEAIRALPESEAARMPAIALTALSREADRARALEAGFDLQLAKPVDIAELVERVTELLGREP